MTGRTRSRGCTAAAAALLLSACAGTAPPPGDGAAAVTSRSALPRGEGAAATLPPGRGLFASYARERLPREGFPSRHSMEYFSEEWGALYDEQGKPYGPNTLYVMDRRLDNPDLVVTDSTLATSRVRIRRNAVVTEPVMGHFVELLELALHDISDILKVTPDRLVEVDAASDLEDYQARWGREYWLTHTVDASATPQLVFEPVDVLFARKVAGVAIYNAAAQLLLQQRVGDRLAPWLYYGLASYLATEGNMLTGFVNEFRDHRPVLLAPDETDRHLRSLVDRENGRVAFYNAFLMTWHLCENWGFDRVQTLLDALSNGATLDEAAQRAYGRDWAAVTAMVDPRVLGEPQGARFGMRTPPPPEQGPPPSAPAGDGGG